MLLQRAMIQSERDTIHSCLKALGNEQKQAGAEHRFWGTLYGEFVSIISRLVVVGRAGKCGWYKARIFLASGSQLEVRVIQSHWRLGKILSTTTGNFSKGQRRDLRFLSDHIVADLWTTPEWSRLRDNRSELRPELPSKKQFPLCGEPS